MDIELAIERLMVTDHIKNRPEILTGYFTMSKVGPIPGFHTIPYVIDYGVIITGSTVRVQRCPQYLRVVKRFSCTFQFININRCNAQLK